MVTGELENTLRAQMDDYINSRLSGLQEEIARLQSQINESFTRVLERSQGETQTNTEVAALISDVIRAAHERGIEDAAAESSYKKASSEMAILKAGVDDISEQGSQAGILKSLVNRAASFAPRVAFFVVRNEEAVGWRARGLAGTVGDDAVREIVLPLSADTPLSDVVRSRTTWSGQPGGNAEDYLLLNKLGSEPPQRMVAIPLVARGKAAAVLYADSAALDADAINLEALETLVRVAGIAVELVAVARPSAQPSAQPAKAEPEAATVTAPQAEQEAAEEAQLPEAQQRDQQEAGDAASPAVEAEAPAQEFESIVAEEAAPTAPVGDETVEMEAPAVSAEANPSSEAPAEAEQAEPSPSVAEQYVAPLGGARSYGRAADAAELPVEVGSDEERRLHNDARRFARLLVSEIKLYNKERVDEGRAGGDLYSRLREDIDRSRQMYDKRVAPPVAARYDYFHQELVNTLADGDAAKLGNGYPGAAA